MFISRHWSLILVLVAALCVVCSFGEFQFPTVSDEHVVFRPHDTSPTEDDKVNDELFVKQWLPNWDTTINPWIQKFGGLYLAIMSSGSVAQAFTTVCQADTILLAIITVVMVVGTFIGHLAVKLLNLFCCCRRQHRNKAATKGKKVDDITDQRHCWIIRVLYAPISMMRRRKTSHDSLSVGEEKKSPSDKAIILSAHRPSALEKDAMKQRLGVWSLVTIHVVKRGNNTVPIGVYRHKTTNAFVRYTYEGADAECALRYHKERNAQINMCFEPSNTTPKTNRGVGNGFVPAKKLSQTPLSCEPLMHLDEVVIRAPSQRIFNTNVATVSLIGHIYRNYNDFLCQSAPIYISSQELKPEHAYVPNGETRVWECDGDVCTLKNVTHTPQETANQLDRTVRKYATKPLVRSAQVNTELMKTLVNIARTDENAQEHILALVAQVDDYKFNEVYTTAMGLLKSAEKLQQNVNFFKGLWQSLTSPIVPKPVQEEAKQVVVTLDDITRDTNIQWSSSKTIDTTTLLKVARDGDMIVVHGRHALGSLIGFMQAKFRDGYGAITHTMTIVTTKTFYMEGMRDDKIYVMHQCVGGMNSNSGGSDTSSESIPDVSGLARNGNQVQDVEEILSCTDEHDSVMIYCPLNDEARAQWESCIGPNRKTTNCAFVSEVLPRVLNRTYPLNVYNFLMLANNYKFKDGLGMKKRLSQTGVANMTPMGSEMFCSELSALICTAAGLFKGVMLPLDEIPWKEEAPLKNAKILKAVEEGRVCVPRQVCPIDFFHKKSQLPYLFNPLSIILPIHVVSEAS